MTNIAYQDVAGGVIHIYTANKHLPKWERLRKARKELESVACIVSGLNPALCRKLNINHYC